MISVHDRGITQFRGWREKNTEEEKKTTSPLSPDGNTMGVLKPGSQVYGLGLEGIWLRIALFGEGDGQFTTAYMMTTTPNITILVPVVPKM